MGVECPTCGSKYSGERGMRVHHARVHDERLPNRECANCNEEFYSEEERKYCSESCREDSVSFAGAKNPNWNGGKEKTACRICGDTFEYYPSEKPGKYCQTCVEEESWRHRPEVSGEDHPRWKGGEVELTCSICDATFERHPSNVNGEVSLCSDECQYEWLSDAFTGEGHPNWRGGGNEDYGEGWNEVRELALDRDDRLCVYCGTTAEELGRNPDVHHVVPVRAFVEHETLVTADAHTPDNVVSLCQSCHRRAEFGRISPTRLRWLAGIRSAEMLTGAHP